MHLITSLDLREINHALLGILNEVQTLRQATKTAAPASHALTTSFVSGGGFSSGGGSSSSASGVSSVFGRQGDVTATTGDYSVAQITGAAPLASPVFTGIPLVPVPAAHDDSLQATNTAWVRQQGFLRRGPGVTLWLVAMNADGTIQIDADGYAAIAPSLVMADAGGGIAVDAEGFVIPQALSVSLA